MKILMVSWEYPPVVIGGLGRHAHHLSTALAAAGPDLVALSRRPTGTGPRPPPAAVQASASVPQPTRDVARGVGVPGTPALAGAVAGGGARAVPVGGGARRATWAPAAAVAVDR